MSYTLFYDITVLCLTVYLVCNLSMLLFFTESGCFLKGTVSKRKQRQKLETQKE